LKSSGNWLNFGFPASAITNHDVDDREQLTHAGSNDNFEWFLISTLALVERLITGGCVNAING
jgi:hypothetical protein